MFLSPVVALLHYFLFAVQSAPVSSPSDPPPAFREAAERAKALVEKILRDIPAVHAAAVNAEVHQTSESAGLLLAAPLLHVL